MIVSNSTSADKQVRFLKREEKIGIQIRIRDRRESREIDNQKVGGRGDRRGVGGRCAVVTISGAKPRVLGVGLCRGVRFVGVAVWK